MKNRRLVLVAFLLCASILVGVGYATISGTFIVNGDVSFDANYENELDGVVFFSGTAYKVDRNHQVVESDEITFNLSSGTLEATLKAHFTGNSTAGFIDNGDTGTPNLIAGVVFEIEIDNTEGTEDLTLTFEEAMVEGNVGSESPFTVTSAVKDASGVDGGEEPGDLTNAQVTVDAGATDTVYLHVRMALDDVNTDVETTEFTVSVVVDKVE